VLVGVPVRRMVLPLTPANMPGGSPVALRPLYGAVPPRMRRVLLKPV